MKLCFHIGHHKTGTTSFQRACSNGTDILRQAGILYPREPVFAPDGTRHSGVTSLLHSKGAPATLVAALKELCDRSSDCSLLLLSDESLSLYFGDRKNKYVIDRLIAQLSSVFESVRFFCVYRFDADILLSSIREYIETVGLPPDGRKFVFRRVREMYETAEGLTHHLRAHLTSICYDDMEPSHFCQQLCAAIVGKDVPLNECRLHRTSEKHPKLILGGVVRSIYSNILSSQPFSLEVQQSYEGFMSSMLIGDAAGNKLAADLTRWLEVIIASVREQSFHTKSLNEIYAPFVLSAAMPTSAAECEGQIGGKSTISEDMTELQEGARQVRRMLTSLRGRYSHQGKRTKMKRRR